MTAWIYIKTDQNHKKRRLRSYDDEQTQPPVTRHLPGRTIACAICAMCLRKIRKTPFNSNPDRKIKQHDRTVMLLIKQISVYKVCKAFCMADTSAAMPPT